VLPIIPLMHKPFSVCWIKACNKIDLERYYNKQIDLCELIMPQELKLRDYCVRDLDLDDFNH
jgi:hypothetical protein